MENLTETPEVLAITDIIRKNADIGLYKVSDVICQKDGRELQFVDLVMEGGGTLGIALVGYIHALEQAGIRFLGMGGSSVGAIVSLLAYSCGERTEARGDKLASIIGEMDLGELVDGGFLARRVSKRWARLGIDLSIVGILQNLILSVFLIAKKLGLNPGDRLLEWISNRLSENDIHTLADLNELTAALPEGLCHRKTRKRINNYNTSLRVVATDVTTSTKVIFPDMAAMYWHDPNAVNPACFARASASIPGFFQPFTVKGISTLIGNGEKWKRLGSFTGELPDTVSFVDGGLLSNFPIDLFKRLGVPRAPTFGVRLGSKHRTAVNVDKIGKYALRLLDTLRHNADYDFIFKNPLYNQLIAHIPTEDFHWLDFNMSEEDKRVLFCNGVEAGYQFLERFKWQEYKDMRTAELAVYRLRKATHAVE